MRNWLWIMVVVLFLPAFCVSAADSDILINEVFYDAVGSDTGKEFIEIFNKGVGVIDLSGWKIEKAISSFGTAFTFPDGAMIAPGDFLLIGENDIAGKNFSATLAFGNAISGTVNGVRIISKNGEIIDALLYGSNNTNNNLPDKNGVTATVFAPSVLAGHSLSRNPDGNNPNGNSGDFVDLTTPTPRNAIVLPTPTPTSTTPIIPPDPYAPVDYSLARNLMINEILADPKGNDGENEFIEIYNPNSSAVDLTGFYVDDAEGGSAPHLLSDETIIEAGGYLVFYAYNTKLALNNTGDSARLLLPDKTVLISAGVEKTPHEDWSYARKSDGSWEWTSEPTPGEENEFVTPVETPSPTPTPKPTATPKPPKPTKTPKPTATPKGRVKATDSETTKNYTVRRASGAVLGTSVVAKTVKIVDLGKEKIGTLISTQGRVAQLPGAFDTRLMYLAGSGVGVFLASGNYPALELGDTVSVTGVLVKPGKELFVSVKVGDDIAVGELGTLPEPHALALKDIDDEKIGWLVKTDGAVTKSEKDKLEISADGKTIKVLMGENRKELKAGEKVSVTGILSADESGLRILASEIAVKNYGDQKTTNSSWLLLFIKKWKTSVGVVCFGCALMLAILVYFPKVSTLRTVPKVLKN